MKRMLSLILALCMITALLVGCGTKDTPANNDTDTKAVTISVGTYSAANSVDGVAMEYFKEYVEEKSGGRIKVDVYHNNQLGDTNGQIENVIMGTQDIFLTGIDPLMQWAPP